MTAFFIILGIGIIAVALGAAFTTWFAIGRAREGYEDEAGFHFGEPERKEDYGETVIADIRAPAVDLASGPRPTAAEPVGSQIPVGLVGAR